MLMIHLETDIEGKQMTFGDAEREMRKQGLVMGGNWDYDRGLFDGILHRESGETIYLRLPFQVLEGELDREDAVIEFLKPFVIKHVVHVGLDKTENSLLSITGFNQFQKPLDQDGHIHDKNEWQEFGEELVGNLLDTLGE